MAVAIHGRIRRGVDDKVDAAESSIWRRVTASRGGDPAGYDTCCANFGADSASSLGATGVPAPVGLVLVVLSLALGTARQH